jgi:hypothetical protein
MSDAIIELVKIVGSLSGLFATGFLLWDRYYKHFPVAIIVARPLTSASVNIVHRLSLQNVSDRPVLITWEHSDRAQLRVAKDDSIHGIVKSQLEGETVIAVEAGEEFLLPILKPSNYDDIDRDNVLQIRLRWRFAQPRVWKSDRTILVSIKKRDFDSMVDAYMSPIATDD